jgi:predicted type IV restriction endonuclease
MATMKTPDTGLEILHSIVEEFASFVSDKGRVSEADTRVKLIDRILTEICGWPEEALAREEHVESGFIDYSLTVQGRRYLAVEAKREGLAFVLPATTSRTLKLSGAILTDKEVREAIAQVRSYCDDGGIRYAIATNGYSWIVFRAIQGEHGMARRECAHFSVPRIHHSQLHGLLELTLF